MLRIIQNSSAKGAKSYYSTADYYTEGQELQGVWRGKGAERLGLDGPIDKGDWDALCDNRDPNTGEKLTPRQKETRRVGYDFNLHAPKSVSLVYGLTGDERILEAFREAVAATMGDMEAEVQTRVRKGGKNEDRTTGNMVWGEFIHTTARPVDGVPDPHLHAHCFVQNLTYDSAESRWKAGEFSQLKRDAPYFEAAFHSRLALGLAERGIPVTRTQRGWEIDGIARGTLMKFARRTDLIEAKAIAEGITDPEAKGALGAKTRVRKAKQLSLAQLKELWRSRLSDDERDAINATKSARESEHDQRTAAQRAVDLALGHCLERSAVVPERTLLLEAMKRAYGMASPESVRDALAAQDVITGEYRGERVVTTKEVLAEEQRMIDFARDGRGTRAPLAPSPHSFKRDWLNAGQRRAVEHVLGSRDRVTAISGKAGVGKTAMMQETVEAIEAGGHKVFTFAPSADASRCVLRGEGFANADTVACLLVDERLQKSIAGQVVWIDEAGLLGSRAMAQVFELADRYDARVILSGDRKQHGSVERGSVLRLLETDAGVAPVEIREIQRQKGDYKRAVEALAEGRTTDGLAQLDRLGWIRELPDDERYQTLAQDYAATTAAGKKVLVVSPTHFEGDCITAAIRSELKREGRLKETEHTVSTLVNANLTEAERSDPGSYAPGDVLVFHQNAEGRIRRGARMEAGRGPLPVAQAQRFQVYRPGTLRLAAGDLVRITRNGKTADGKHELNNGATYRVQGFTKAGDIKLANGWKVAKDYGHLTYGYVSTSHASQGKTVDCVLIGQSSASARAASREQIYVSASRGRARATIYTDAKADLLEAVSRSTEQLSASEVISLDKRRQRSVAVQRIQQAERERPPARQPKREAENVR